MILLQEFFQTMETVVNRVKAVPVVNRVLCDITNKKVKMMAKYLF